MRGTRLKLIVLALLSELMFGCAPAYALDVWFAPEQDCTAVIVAELDKATKSIDYQLYNFTSQPIGDALIRATKRGVSVRMLLDSKANENNTNSQAARCKRAGCAVK